MNVNEDISQKVGLFLEEFKNNEFSENIDKDKLLALLHENFNKINELLNKLNSVNLNENNILEILSFLLYSGGFFNNCKNDILQNLYNLYIIKCIKYYSSFIDTFLIQECSQTEINMSNHILNFSKKESNMNYTSILFEITKYTKNIFMESKNNYRYQNDEEYRKKIVNIYIHINTEDYLLYLIMKEHCDEFSSLLSSLKNNIISKNDIIEILNNYDDKRSIVERIYDKILLNDKNCDYSDLKEFILNLLKNGMKTNYYFEDKFKYILSLYDTQFITLFKPFEDEKYLPFLDLIENIKQLIIGEGILYKDNIDEMYPIICNKYIEKFKLNKIDLHNETTINFFFDYFMLSKSECQLCISLDKIPNLIEKISKK